MTVVGRQLSKQAGLGAKILTATASCGANVEMLSYAQGSINFAMLIDDQDVAAVVPHLHKILFEG